MVSNTTPSQNANSLSDAELDKIAKDRLDGLRASMAETKKKAMDNVFMAGRRTGKSGMSKDMWPGIFNRYGKHYTNSFEDEEMDIKMTDNEREYIKWSAKRGATLSQEMRDKHIETLSDRVVGMMQELDRLERLKS